MYTRQSICTRLSLVVRDIIWVIIPVAILLERNASSTESVNGHLWRTAGVALGLVLCCVLVVGTVLVISIMTFRLKGRKTWRKCVRGCACCKRDARARENLRIRRRRCCSIHSCRHSSRTKRFLLLAAGIMLIWSLISLFVDYGKPLEVLAVYCAAIGYILSFTTNALFFMGFNGPFVMYVTTRNSGLKLFLIITISYRLNTNLVCRGGAGTCTGFTTLWLVTSF